jgi:small GTP-binding protein
MVHVNDILNDSEQKKITHSCSISNHPVSKLPMKIRENYLQGLRTILPMSEPFMNTLFKAWEISILGKKQSLSYNSSNLKEKVKRAIKVHRIGWHWFRLAYPFFFDCFYLTSLCGNTNAIQRQYEKLSEYCNLFTKKALQRVYEYFKNGTLCERIPEQLVKHRDVNLKFGSAQIKRVLVVANVSAGKSTLINALVGHKLNKTATNACTKELCYIYGKPQKDGLTIKTRKEGLYLYDNSIDRYSSDNASQIGVFFSSGLLQGKKICFIDTPGYNDARNPERKNITEKAIRSNDYDTIIYVANAAYMGRDDEHQLLETIIQNTKKPIIFVMNRVDKYKPSEDSIEESVKKYHNDIEMLGVKNPKIVPISARAALLMRMSEKNLLDEDEKFDLKIIESNFSKDYYDLPKYTQNNQFRRSNLIDKTGISLLERIISSINIK